MLNNMTANTTRTDGEHILAEAREKLREHTGLDLHPVAHQDDENDGLARLTGQGSAAHLFRIALKRRPTQTGLLLETHQESPSNRPPTLLVSEYIPPPMAGHLRDRGINFMDCAGNAHLKTPGLFVFISGNRPPPSWRRDTPVRAFQRTGLQVIFVLLADPARVNASHRELAKLAGVSTGSVVYILDDLRDLGHVVSRPGNRRHLRDRRALLERWIEGYAERLRPRLSLGRFRGAERWWEQADLQGLEARWGGEIAAARLTDHLQPALATLYLRGRETGARLQVQCRLRRDSQGNTELLRSFWDATLDTADGDLVPPLIAYADLIASGDSRNLETANLLYEQRLAGYLDRD